MYSNQSGKLNYFQWVSLYPVGQWTHRMRLAIWIQIKFHLTENTKTAVRDGHRSLNLCLTLTFDNVKNNVNKTSKTFRPNNFGLHRFFKKPTEWRLSNGSQFCACYASKNITNDRCAWLREGFVNIWDVNVFVSCVVVSLRIPSLEKKSPNIPSYCFYYSIFSQAYLQFFICIQIKHEILSQKFLLLPIISHDNWTWNQTSDTDETWNPWAWNKNLVYLFTNNLRYYKSYNTKVR